MKTGPSGDGGRTFVFLTATTSSTVFAPIIAIYLLVERPHIDLVQMLFILGTGIWHIGYALCLQRGYATGDLSIVYPIARGTGPVIAVTGAVVLLGERPPIAALCGALAVAGRVRARTAISQERSSDQH